MRILACVKQVPDTSEIKVDPVTNTLIRKGVPSIVNPMDLNAVETAVTLKEQNPDTTITLLSMGPPPAEEALRECLSMGCDDAFLLTDRAFGGADTYATSYSLYVATKYIEELKGEKFDLIICGIMAVDGDTGQVGPELAEHLGIPQVTYCIGAELKGGKVVTKRAHEMGYEVLESQLPCLLAVTKDINKPRRGTVRGKIAAKRAKVEWISADMLGDALDRTRIGLKGSPTNVRSAHPPKMRTRGEDVTGKDAKESVANLMAKLTENNLI
ncbi:MAG: electron transfer flavoprotein subunit beta/FixA family protein [Peptococcaceae bacterium]|nr:electron transfer flavoprotein subunit beta/FixA family protein [Peptococcaceae bacterium]